MINNRYNFCNKIEFDTNDFSFNFTFDQMSQDSLNQTINANARLEDELTLVVSENETIDNDVSTVVVLSEDDENSDFGINSQDELTMKLYDSDEACIESPNDKKDYNCNDERL